MNSPVPRSVFPDPMTAEPLSEALHAVRHEEHDLDCHGDPAAALDQGCPLRAEAYATASRLREFGVVSIDSLLEEFITSAAGNPPLAGVEIVATAAEVYARIVAGDESAGVKYRVADLVYAVAMLARTQGFTVEHALRERTRLETLVQGLHSDHA